MIGIIGDSLTWQGGKGPVRIGDALTRAGVDTAGLRIDAAPGRGIRGGIAVVKQWSEEGYLPSLWLIALGTNNLNADTNTLDHAVSALVDAIEDTTPTADLHWVGVGLRFADPRVKKVNEVIWDWNLGDFYDWNAHVHDGRDEAALWLPTDAEGVHMTAAGYQVRNDYLAGCVTP